jgi:hypothetical protein
MLINTPSINKLLDILILNNRDKKINIEIRDTLNSYRSIINSQEFKVLPAEEINIILKEISQNISDLNRIDVEIEDILHHK